MQTLYPQVKPVTTRHASGQWSGCTHVAPRKHANPNIRTGFVKSEEPLFSPRVRPRVYCPRVFYDTVAQYGEHFFLEYCLTPLKTFDGITVIFRPTDFEHAFFEGDNKDRFAPLRAVRVDWIGEALRDRCATLYIGWNSSTSSYDDNRRTCLVNGDYLVVIAFVARNSARFVTAFPTSRETRELLERSPRW